MRSPVLDKSTVLAIVIYAGAVLLVALGKADVGVVLGLIAGHVGLPQPGPLYDQLHQ